MGVINIFIQISCASILILSGLFYLWNKHNKDVGLNLLGIFLLTLGIQYSLLLYEDYFESTFSIFIREINLYNFLLHSYIPLLYLITYHSANNLDKIEKTKLYSLFITLAPILLAFVSKALSVDKSLLNDVTSFSGCIIISTHNLNYVKKSTTIDARSLKILKHINTSFLLMIIVWVIVLLNRHFSAVNENLLIGTFLVIQLYLVYGIILNTIRHPGIVNPIENISQPINTNDQKKQDTKYANSKLSDSEISDLKAKIEIEIAEKRYYLDPENSLENLAERLTVSPRVISQVINSSFNTNYSDLINDYRLERAKALLKKHSNDELNISQVMYESGFSSTSSFYGYFKKKLNMTPREFRSQNS
ncbi:MAG: helix-turn-helix transcriptional regulator [Ekhidna sp.]|nr:helix-turn-helix transcriptional regulator [Ekhidna sp.]